MCAVSPDSVRNDGVCSSGRSAYTTISGLQVWVKGSTDEEGFVVLEGESRAAIRVILETAINPNTGNTTETSASRTCPLGNLL